jgi:hypothetical protein
VPNEHPTHPETGERAVVRDVREQFAKLTGKVPRDVEAERAFILAKIETVRKDLRLTDREKRAAIRALKALLS